MKKIRKKRFIDGTDREIIRILNKKSPLVTRRIGKYVGLTSPSIILRLNNLKEKGILRIVNVSKMRVYERVFGNKTILIKSPKKILWDIDLKE
jgi:DNA-binding Lrp family transcriptional regulator